MDNTNTFSYKEALLATATQFWNECEARIQLAKLHPRQKYNVKGLFRQAYANKNKM